MCTSVDVPTDAGGILAGFPAIVADAALLRGLQESGLTAWCIEDTNPQALAKALQQLDVWRSLPPSMITQIKACYNILKVQVWKRPAHIVVSIVKKNADGVIY